MSSRGDLAALDRLLAEASDLIYVSAIELAKVYTWLDAELDRMGLAAVAKGMARTRRRALRDLYTRAEALANVANQPALTNALDKVKGVVIMEKPIAAEYSTWIVVDTVQQTSKRADRRVIGFDPATKASGWAVIGLDDKEQREAVLRAGVYRPPGIDRVAGLAGLYDFTRRLMDVFDPVAVAIETVFYGPNAKTTIELAEVGAVIRLAACQSGIGIVNVAPAERAGTLGLGGRASKRDIVEAVNRIYGVELDDHNAADAVAIAATCAALLRAEAMSRLRL